jgi:hypothetical protein
VGTYYLTKIRKSEQMMQEVYQELLDKCEKYSKTIIKLKQYMGKITKEYDRNVELLLQKLEKQVVLDVREGVILNLEE